MLKQTSPIIGDQTSFCELGHPFYLCHYNANDTDFGPSFSTASQISSPTPGTFIIALHYKGREKAILEMDLKIDDLLEKRQENVTTLDLEYVSLDVDKILNLLNKTFRRK